MTTTDTGTPAGESPEDATPDIPETAGAEPPETPVRFWDRPYADRYLSPILLPLLIVGGLAMFVINVSRIFLAGHGEVPVIIGTIITVAIIAGAAVLSAAPNLRSSSLTLVTAAFVGAIVLAGWLSLGAAAPEEEGGAALPPEGPADTTLDFSTEGVRFVPDAAEAETGIVRIDLVSNSGQHTFLFEEAATQFPGLAVGGTGAEDFGRAFLGEPGEYVFYCDIPGHREAGMEGTITATGEPKVFEEEVARLGTEGGEAPAGEEAPAE